MKKTSYHLFFLFTMLTILIASLITLTPILQSNDLSLLKDTGTLFDLLKRKRYESIDKEKVREELIEIIEGSYRIELPPIA